MTSLQFMWIGDVESQNEVLQNPDALKKERCHPKKMVVLDQKETRIGRRNSKYPPDYALESAVSNRMISRSHVTVERVSKGNYMLYDHSLNGTYVNFVRVIGGVMLKNNDIVCFGHINGANIKPGESVTPYATDLKYRVVINDPKFESSQNESSQDEDSNIRRGRQKRRKPQSDVSEESDESMEETAVKPHRPKYDSTDSSSGEGDMGEMAQRFKKQKMRHPSTNEGRNKRGEINRSMNRVKKQEQSLVKRPRMDEKMSKDRDRQNRISSSRKSGVSSSVKKYGDKLSNRRNGGLSGSNTNVNSSNYEVEECKARPCQRPSESHVIDWIACDKCNQWYHQSCVGFDQTADDDDKYFCPYCIN